VLHDIPQAIDRALRERAAATGTTVDAVAADALARGLNGSGRQVGPSFHDLDSLAGSDPLEPTVLDALAVADRIHPHDWTM
jgi:hypothetical protein